METIKRLIYYIKCVNVGLNFVFLGCILLVILDSTIFYRLPEIFVGGGEILDALHDISVGYVVSYIFYFMVVHIRDIKDKENIRNYVLVKSKSIICEYESIVYHLKRSSGINCEGFYLTSSEFYDVFSKISPQKSWSYFTLKGQVSWIDELNNSRIRTEKIISKIYIKMNFLDSEYVNLLSRIEESSYFKLLEPMDIIDVKIGNKNMIVWSRPFYDYSLLIRELDLLCRSLEQGFVGGVK